MKTTCTLVMLLFITSFTFAQKNKQEQIDMAVLAAPEQVRAEATVYGFDDDGKFVLLRKGTNDYVVRSDDPNKAGFEVVCYPANAEAFMARGRALKAEGKGLRDVWAIREKEAEAGTLKMPSTGSMLHIYAGKEAKYNVETKALEGGSFRYIVYMPLATTETSGYPTSPNERGHPWLMFPGLHRAHIMITPIKPPKEEN